MTKFYTIPTGKIIQKIARIRGGGSALPGLVIEKIDPKFIADTLNKLPYGVVVISGTNGKTTTTKMVVELLESQGLKVFTNKTGSNFVRGVAAALINEVNLNGKLNADIAVLELDEAHAVHFIKKIKPTYSLILNVLRDQLDRFGEIDYTAKLLEKVVLNTTKTVVLNREDPLVSDMHNLAKSSVKFFGLSDETRKLFPNDDELKSQKSQIKSAAKHIHAASTLEKIADNQATFTLNGKNITTPMQLRGVYNLFNAAAALALVSDIIGDKNLNINKLISSLANVKPAFGRGESLIIDGLPLDLILVKNPSGFQLGLNSFQKEGVATMIAINDQYADGRDMSWLWDVSFDSLKKEGVQMISGIRAYDMSVRLQYEEVSFEKVNQNLKEALEEFLQENPKSPKRIFCTYTAMLEIRQHLAKITDVDKVL